MNVVDSSGWLEFFANGQNAGFFSPPIQDTPHLLVSAVNLYEVFKCVLRQRGEGPAFQAVSAMQQATVIDLDQSLALVAARISSTTKLPMADSIILATARTHEAILWTQDTDFEDIEGVRFVSKRS